MLFDNPFPLLRVCDHEILPFPFLGGLELPFFLSIILSNLWPRFRSTYNPGSISFYLSVFTFWLKNMLGGENKVGAEKLCNRLLQFECEGIFSCSIPLHVNLNCTWSGKFIFYYFWGSKHLWDSLSHLILTRTHQEIITPILQMKGQRFRLICPDPQPVSGSSKSQTWPVAFLSTPTLSHLEFDNRVTESLF